ncbi:hypothetical protein VNO78_16461 [Psophocarpus tetragonolobus]|uniref:Uncharacterized protein n=1 Tax=Psophocarpus tetragonolobus TaxID=3891 RepID=A0AAN9SGW1_PSOTE
MGRILAGETESTTLHEIVNQHPDITSLINGNNADFMGTKSAPKTVHKDAKTEGSLGPWILAKTKKSKLKAHANTARKGSQNHASSMNHGTSPRGLHNTIPMKQGSCFNNLHQEIETAGKVDGSESVHNDMMRPQHIWEAKCQRDAQKHR